MTKLKPGDTVWMIAGDRTALRYAGRSILVIAGIAAGAAGIVHLTGTWDTRPALLSAVLAALYGAFLLWRGRQW